MRVLLLLVLLLPLAGQVVAQEVQVPFDEAGRVTVLDAAMARGLDRFASYRGFREARLFRLSEDRFVLEVLYRPDDQVVRDRVELTAAGVAALRREVSAGLTMQAANEIDRDDARTRLLIGSTVLGFAFYGWAVPVALGIEDGSVATSLYLLTSSAGFFVPYLLTRDRAVPEAAASLALYGATRGPIHGALFSIVPGGDFVDEEGTLALAVAFGVAEGIAGFGIAGRRSMRAGTAETVGVLGDIGMLFGLGTSVLVAGDEADERLIGTLGLGGAAAGLYGGYRLALAEDYSRGDARVLDALSMVGALTGFTVADVVDRLESARLGVGLTMAGTTGGLMLGRALLRGQEFSSGQGTFVKLGTVGGGLVGGALGFLITGEEGADEMPSLILGLSALGSAAGFGLMYSAYRANPQNLGAGWGLEVQPAAVLLAGAGRAPRVPTTLFRLHRRF